MNQEAQINPKQQKCTPHSLYSILNPRPHKRFVVIPLWFFFNLTYFTELREEMASCNNFYTLWVPLSENESKFGGVAWLGVVFKIRAEGGGGVKSHKIWICNFVNIIHD